MRPAWTLGCVGALVAAAAAAQAPAGELVLVLGGDVIFDAPIEYALRRTDRPRDEAASYAPIFEDLRPVLEGAHHAIVNLETPVAERTRSSGPGEPPRFAAPRAFLAALAEAGVDAVTLANNHAYDQGVAGLGETLAAVRAAHLVGIGAGERSDAASPRYLEIEGHRVALLAFTEGTNWRVLDEEADDPRVAVIDVDHIARAVAEARAHAAFVAVAFHWDEGRDHVPSPRMRRYARLAADAGADLVWGHGTHLPAGVSVVASADGRSVPVIWSLGNLVAVMNADDEDVHTSEPSVRESWLATVRLRPEGARLAVAAIDPAPFWIGVSEREGAPPFVRPLSLSRERAALASMRCGRRCERLAAAYEARAHRAERTLRLEPSIGEGHAPMPEARFDAVPVASREPAPTESAPSDSSDRDATTEALAAVDRADEASIPDRTSDEARPSATEVATAEVSVVPTGGARSSVAAAEAPRVEAPTAVVPADPASTPRRLASDLGPLASGALRLGFEAERSVESTIDAAQLAAIVTALRADGRLHLEIVGHPSGPADRALWSRRAARARGVVAIRGPSRSRIHARVGAIEATPGLTYQLVR